MQLKIIKTPLEYELCMNRANELLDKKVSPESPEGYELEIALLLIKQYEDVHFAIPLPDPHSGFSCKNGREGTEE